MKSLKYIVVSIVSLLSLRSLSIQAVPNFEIYNKDQANGRIKVTLSVDNKNIVTDKIVDPDEAYQTTVDLQKPVKVTIFTTNQKNMPFLINAPGKTKYFSWNTAKSIPLYPQTGPWMGLKGKTESGLPLGNNLSASQIQKQ